MVYFIRSYKRQSYLEGAHESLVDAHHPPGVVELPAVVRRREQCHQLPLCVELITILHNLHMES